MTTKTRTINKRLPTNEDGIFYKQIVDDKNKEVDKTFIIRYREDGKDLFKTVGKYSAGIRVAYCKQIRNDILNKHRLGEEPPAIIKKKKKDIITFDTIAYNYFTAREHIRKGTAKEKRKYENHIKPYIGSINIDKLTTAHIEKIKHDKTNKVADSYVNSFIFLIGTIIRFATKQGIYKNVNPTQNIENIKIDNKREKYLDLEEIQSLLDAVDDDKQLKLFVLLSLHTGGRLSTILSIKKKDINLINNSVTLIDYKNTSTYTGYYDNTLKEILKDTIEQLNINDTLISIHKATLEDKIRPILRKLFNTGLDKDDRKHTTVIHTLRHTFASHLAIKGTPILTIQKLMNHKDIKMTLRYAHLAPDVGKEVVQGLYSE